VSGIARAREARQPAARGALGVTLVELIIFIVIVMVALTATILAFNTLTKSSPEPLIRKQALAAAEALLEEVQLMPFTFCDPDDPNARTATSTAGCTGGVAGSEDGTIGPEAGEARFGGTPFDNVSDYHGYTSSPNIVDIQGATVVTGYSAAIEVTQGGLGLGIGVAANVLKVKVTVTAPDGTQIALEGYRTRYAPNTLP
jgi:MSHA pilin protein MshD